MEAGQPSKPYWKSTFGSSEGYSTFDLAVRFQAQGTFGKDLSHGILHQGNG